MTLDTVATVILTVQATMWDSPTQHNLLVNTGVIKIFRVASLFPDIQESRGYLGFDYKLIIESLGSFLSYIAS